MNSISPITIPHSDGLHIAYRWIAVIELIALLIGSLGSGSVGANIGPPATQERRIEWTIESRKTYADPFNDVDVVFYEKR